MLAPLRVSESPETAALSVTHAPIGKGGKNWITKTTPGNTGQLPAYIQNVRNGIMKSGKSESEATQLAIGVVRNWASGKGKVSPEVRAAAGKAVAEFEALRAKSGAKKVTESVTFLQGPLERAIRDESLRRVAVMEQRMGVDGLIALLAAPVLLEADNGAWSPTTKRIASASGEKERHQVMDGDQHVGTVASRTTYGSEPDRWRASAVNGEQVGDYSMPSKAKAISSLKKHLEEAPARVQPFTGGQFLVAQPRSYSGATSYQAFPSEAVARYNAGLPASASTPEQNSQVDALGEALRFDLEMLSAIDIPALRRVQQTRREASVLEHFHEDLTPPEPAKADPPRPKHARLMGMSDTALRARLKADSGSSASERQAAAALIQARKDMSAPVLARAASRAAAASGEMTSAVGVAAPVRRG